MNSKTNINPAFQQSFQIFTHKQLQSAASFINNLSDTERKTFKAIASRCNFQDKTFSSTISYKQIVTITGQSIRTAKRHVKVLIEQNLIKIKHNGYICPKTKQNRQSANTFNFQLSNIKMLCNKVRAKICQKKNKCHSNLSPLLLTNSPHQLNNIKHPAMISFLSIKAMFKQRKSKQYIDTDTGLLFATYNDRIDYRNAIGYVKTRQRSHFIYDFIQYLRKNNLDKVLDSNWLKQTELQIKAKKTAQPQIDYRFSTVETVNYKHQVNDLYFLNEESRLAIIKRDRQWK